LTWEDLNYFEALLTKTPLDQDDLYKKIKDYNPNYLKLQNAPNYKGFDDKLKTKRNNLERLIYVLSNIDSESLLNGRITKQLLFGLQAAFLSVPMKKEKAMELLNKPVIDFSTIEVFKNEDAYLFIDGVPVMEDLDCKIFMSLKNHDVISKISVPVLNANYNKASWEHFWTIFNWLQFSLDDFKVIFNENSKQAYQANQASSDDILDNFDVSLAPIVTELIANGIDFNKESSFYLEDENGGIIAEAALGIPSRKIIVDPFDDESRAKFIKAGYTEVSIEKFNIKDII
jgi:hypothetical protein